MFVTPAPTATETSEPASPLRVLLVEDNPGDARLVQLLMEDCRGFALDHAATLAEGLGRIPHAGYDVILLDLSLPDAQGDDAFRAMHAGAPTLPIVVLTGLNDRELALRMVQAGAQDYVVKGSFLESRTIERILRYAVERHHLLREVEAARERESEQKDLFLAHVSHQLRSPLTVAYLYTTNVIDGIVGPVSDQQREHLVVAAEAMRAQKRLIDELLAAVRADATLIGLDRKPLSIAALIDQTVALVGSRCDGARLRVEVEGGLSPVLADGHRVQQVLTNLLDNALKYAPPDGIVHIRAWRGTTPGFVRVDVVDNGTGIPEALRHRVFERLFRSDSTIEGQGGLGLGLYLARLIVNRHGGRIWVEPVEPTGSRFSFSLPVAGSGEATGR